MSGGYRRYLLNILPRLAGHGQVESILCASPAGLGVSGWFSALPKVGFVDCEPFRVGRHRPDSRLKGILRDFHPQVLFMPVERMVEFEGIPSVVMLQNMSPLVPSGEWGLKGRLRRVAQYFETRLAVRKSTRVIAISRFVKDYLVDRLDVPPDKIDIIYYGSNLPQGEVPIPSAFGQGQPKSFLFTAGSAEPYRGWEDLMGALKELASRHVEPVRLVIGGVAQGDAAPYAVRMRHLAEECGVGSSICWAGHLSRAEMSWCYANCLAFVMASRVESFGFVSLEALAHGAACIAADNPPSPEIFGDQAVYYKPRDSQSLADAIGIVLGRSVAERGEMARRAMERAGRFSWDVAAERTVETLARAICVGDGSRDHRIPG